MGFPSPFKLVSRKLTNDVVIASCPFLVSNKFHVGGRMALFNYQGKIVVWSAVPYGPEVEKSLELLTGSPSNFNITHLIVPNVGHTTAAKSFKDNYPGLKVLAIDEVNIPGVTIDYKVTAKQGNKLIDEKVLREEVGVSENNILDSFEFVYLPNHKSKELVMFDTKSKILFEADLLFNLGSNEPLEQYSPALGFPKSFNPLGGWSFFNRYMQPDSMLGNWLIKKLATPTSQAGLETIQKWDFSKIVMCHGNVIENDAREAFAKAFKF